MITREATPWEVRRLRRIADYQFGWPAGEILIPDNVVVGVSPRTRRIREVYGDEGLLAVLRASDYYYTLSLAGARRLLQLQTPRLRVIVKAAFRGKSVPCNAAIDADPRLRPGDEAIVVDEEDRLIGVGRLRLPTVVIYEESCAGELVRLRKRAGDGV